MSERTRFQVEGRGVGPGFPCFIVAEAGVNHNGELELAKRLVDAALEAGADAVKFQTWVTADLVVPGASPALYQQSAAGDRDQFAMLEGLELGREAFEALKAYSDQRGILFLATPDEEGSADFLDGLGVPLFKIGSGEVTNLGLLGHIAAKQKPIVLSTGMSTLGEVEQAVLTIEARGNTQLVLLHCVSAYPAAAEEANLRAMDTLGTAFGYPVGFSDHTLGLEVSLAAVARGACLIEKHLTLDQAMPGPDHRASLAPGEFASLVRGVRTVESSLGDGRKAPTPGEIDAKAATQKVIVARHALPTGSVLSPDDLALKRGPGGLPASHLPFVVGRRLARDLEPNAILSEDALS